MTTRAPMTSFLWRSQKKWLSSAGSGTEGETVGMLENCDPAGAVLARGAWSYAMRNFPAQAQGDPKLRCRAAEQPVLASALLFPNCWQPDPRRGVRICL